MQNFLCNANIIKAAHVNNHIHLHEFLNLPPSTCGLQKYWIGLF